MFMNLGLLAKGRHGVKRRLPQAVGRLQKEDMSSSLNTVLKRSQLGLLGVEFVMLANYDKT